MKRSWPILTILWIWVLVPFASADEPPAAPFDFATASKNVPKPRAVWPIVKQDMVAPEFTVLSNELVTSDTDPSQKLRKITAHFWSQELAGKTWGHRCVIFLPEDNSRNLTPERMGKVVIVGSPPLRLLPDPRRQIRRADRRADRLSHDGPFQPGRVSGRLRDRARYDRADQAPQGDRQEPLQHELPVGRRLYPGDERPSEVPGAERPEGRDRRPLQTGTQRHGGRRDGLARCVGHHHGKRGRLPHGSRPVASLVPSCVLSGSGQRFRSSTLVQQTKTATRCST